VHPPAPGEETATAAASERRLLARELHDGAAQGLWSLGAEIQCLEKASAASPAELRQRLTELRQTWAQVYEELRDTIAQLHEPLVEGGALVPAIERALERLERQMDVAARLSVTPAFTRAPLDPACEAHLVRVCQSALGNVRRHSQARHVLVALDADAAAVTLLVEDDGVGFDPEAPRRRAADGHGLLMMRERLEALRGSLVVDSSPGRGTRLTVRVPLDVACG